MQLFCALYDRVMSWSRHEHAPWYLGGLSFAESSFFPIPPDVMLAPMSMAQPARAWRFALLTTLASVAGGLFGYLIGYFAFELVAALMAWGGEPMERHLRQYVDAVGWVMVLLIGLVVLLR